MKTVFDKATRDELVNRIGSLNGNNTAQWGKMNLSQMMMHMIKFDEMVLGRKMYKQAFMGKLFGKIALKDFMKEGPVKKNLPTVPEFKITETADDIIPLRKQWQALVAEYAQFSNHALIHPFFGKMSTDQIGKLAYKHADHHLQQFGA